MYSVQNTPGVPFSSPLSEQNVPEKKTDTKTESSIKERTAAPGSDISTLNHALVKADVLGQTLSPKSLSGTQRDERVLATQQFENSLRGIANSDTRLTQEQKNNLQTGIDSVLNQASPQVMTLAPQSMEIQKNQGFYAKETAKYAEFYKQFSNTILAKMDNWISPGKDDKSVIINVADINAALKSFTDSYFLPTGFNSVIFPERVLGSTLKFVTESEAKQWASGLPGTRVVAITYDGYDIVKGRYCVVIDPAPIETIIRDLGNLGSPASDGILVLDKAKFESWQTGFKSQVDIIENSLQTISKKTIEDKVLWENIATTIGQIGKDYLGVYENVVGQYTDFYKSFSDILSKMGGWVSAGKDGNKVKLNITELKTALDTLKRNYSLPNKGAVLFPEQGESSGVKGATEGAAKQWASELGLPETCVQNLADGTFVVVVDLKPIDTMISEVTTQGTADGDGNVELDNAKFQAWQAGFKAQEENLKNTLQTFTQKYSNANSLYDNLVKVLSSTISSCVETAKSFLHG